MSLYRLEIRVTPRPGILDPEGKAIHHALQSLGYAETREVRVGKAMVLELDATSEDEARATADEMCRKLLANPVTEDYEVRMLNEATASGAGRGASREAGVAGSGPGLDDGEGRT